jgi:cell division protein FtsQ
MGRRNSKPEVQKASMIRQRAGLMLAVVVVVALVGGVAYGHHYLSQPGRLPLRVIQINGEFLRLDRADVQAMVEDTIDGGFFSCDMPTLRGAILAMPWVAEVSIRRVWPDRLEMTVTEEIPLARWGDDALINTGARVFQPGSLDGHAELIRLRGPAGSEQRVVAFYQALRTAMRERGMPLSEIELDDRRHWWLRFADGLVVSLGSEQVEHRLAQFFRVYPSLTGQPERRPQRIDMRYAHGFAVRWKERQTIESNNHDGDSQGKA